MIDDAIDSAEKIAEEDRKTFRLIDMCAAQTIN